MRDELGRQDIRQVQDRARGRNASQGEKKYFVLRLDSDDPVEAARVAAAMRAYKNEPRNCDVGTPCEQADRAFDSFCLGRSCETCEFSKLTYRGCLLAWGQLPYREGSAK